MSRHVKHVTDLLLLLLLVPPCEDDKAWALIRRGQAL